MMTLITGFTYLPDIYFKFITKCDKCYYKVRQLFLLQSAMVCYYKLRQLFYCKVRQVFQSVTILIQSADYYKVRQHIVYLARCVAVLIIKNIHLYMNPRLTFYRGIQFTVAFHFLTLKFFSYL